MSAGAIADSSRVKRAHTLPTQQMVTTMLVTITLVAAVAIVLAMPSLAPAAGKKAAAKPKVTKAQLQRQIVDLQNDVEWLEGRINAAETASEEAHDAYLLALDAYSGHLATLYRAGETARVSAIAEVRDIGRAVDTTRYLQVLADYDRQVLGEYRNSRERADAARDDLDDREVLLGAKRDKVDELERKLDNWKEPAKVVKLDVSKDNPGFDDLPPVNADDFFFTRPIVVPSPSGGLRPPADLAPQPAPVGSDPAPAGDTDAPTGGGGDSGSSPGGSAGVGYLEAGEASWYGPGFHGNTTANGETYNMYDFTAAHKSLPFGSIVQVTTSYGASVTVRINDRGPYIGGRIIDLSYAASQAIGMDGVASVTIEVIG